MEVEDEDSILQRLFFKRFGRALPDDKEKEKEDDVDKINFVIDLTDEDEMEVAAPVENVPVAIIKTEPIETVNVNNVANVANVNNVNNVSEIAAKQRRASRRLEIIELAKARKAITEFGKSLRKKEVIPEKEAPEDTNMVEANTVESVNTIETAERVIADSDRRAEQIIADSNAAIEASGEFTAEFGDTPIDEFDE
jgi:hypothetical protein